MRRPVSSLRHFQNPIRFRENPSGKKTTRTRRSKRSSRFWWSYLCSLRFLLGGLPSHLLQRYRHCPFFHRFRPWNCSLSHLICNLVKTFSPSYLVGPEGAIVLQIVWDQINQLRKKRLILRGHPKARVEVLLALMRAKLVRMGVKTLLRGAQRALAYMPTKTRGARLQQALR